MEKAESNNTDPEMNEQIKIFINVIFITSDFIGICKCSFCLTRFSLSASRALAQLIYTRKGKTMRHRYNILGWGGNHTGKKKLDRKWGMTLTISK